MKTAATQIALHHRSSRPLWALLCLALFLSLQLFAGSGSFHRVLHSDASSPDHHCVITLITQGQVNVPVVLGIWLAFATTLIFSLPLLQATVRASFDLRLAPSRAPPRF